MGRFLRALFKLTSRFLLVVVLLCLVLVPALWLGRDSIPPRLAAWLINHTLDAPVVEDLAFRITDVGAEVVTLEGLALNGPDGPAAERVSIGYAWRDLIEDGRIQGLSIIRPTIAAHLTADGAISVAGLDPFIAALSRTESGAEARPANLPTIEIRDGALRLSGVVEGVARLDGGVQGTTARQAITLKGPADLTVGVAGAEISGDLTLSADLGPGAGVLGLLISEGAFSALDGEIRAGAGLDGVFEARWSETGNSVLSGSIAAPHLTLAGHDLQALRLEARLDGPAISAAATATMLDDEGDPVPDGALDLALVVEPSENLDGSPVTRRSAELHATAPLAPIDRVVSTAAGRPPVGLNGTIGLRLSGSAPWNPEAILPGDLRSVLTGLVASGGVDLTRGAQSVDTHLTGRLALAIAAGRLSIETAEPVRLTLPAAWVEARPELADALGEQLPLVREIFGDLVSVSLGDGSEEFAVTVDANTPEHRLDLAGPMVIASAGGAGGGDRPARLRTDLAVSMIRTSDGGMRPTGPISVKMIAEDLAADDVTLSEVRGEVTGRRDGDDFIGTYRVELSVDAPRQGLRDSAVRLAGGFLANPDRITVDLSEGGSIAVRRLAMGDLPRPIEGLVASLPRSTEPPLLAWMRDLEAPGGARTELALRLRPRPFRLEAGADGSGSAIDLDAGRLALDGRIDGKGDGWARVRLTNGAASLADQDIHARGLAVDLRIGFTEGRAGLGRIDLDAQRVVDEAAEITRFVPLSLQASATPAPVRGALNRLRFEATLRGVSGAFVVDAKGHHDPEKGQGRAEITLYPLEFTPGGLQPADISPAASAFLNETAGSVAASGAIRWPSAPGEIEDSPFTLRMSELSFTGSLGQMLGLDGAVTLRAIDPPATPPGQLIQAAGLDMGVPIDSPQIRFQLTPDGLLLLERVDAAFAGGRVWAEDLKVPIASEKPVEVNLNVERVDAAALAELVKLDGLLATGTLSGTIPLLWDPAQGLSVREASLRTDGDGGVIRYNPDEIPAALQGGGEEVSLMLEALRNLVYQRFSISADGRPGDSFQVKLNINGSNPDLYEGHPVDLNVTLSGRLDELFRDVQRVLGITDEVRKRLQDGGRGDGTEG